MNRVPHNHRIAQLPEYTAELQGRRVSIRVNNAPRKSDERRKGRQAKRGNVTAFTRKSRRRLMNVLYSLKKSLASAVFITLTYGQHWPDEETAKRHLDTFVKRLDRICPAASAIWRREYQERGAPHFHLLAFGLPYIKKEEIARMWFEIIGEEYADNSGAKPRAPFTRIEMIIGFRKIAYYLSKYVAKADDQVGLTSGHISPRGRHWGIWNRENLPFADVVTACLDMHTVADFTAYKHFLRNIRRYTGNRVKSSVSRGVTVYAENPERFLDLLAFYRREAVTG